ncbi:MAG TPA: outer membrane beta-barrel protein [Mariniflexile sp.]|nr:outer membrane beta-barrel protein [Mariniflexile sp.]
MKHLKKIYASFNSTKAISKQLLFSLALALMAPMAILAQTGTGIGLKAGLNYNGNGDYFESVSTNAQHPDRNVGYHVGLFGKIGTKVYFKPEVVYTSTKSDYKDADFKMQKLDAPLLVGLKVLGPVSVFGGPALQYILDTEFDGISINDVENDFSVGLNFGIGINFKKVGIDLRYERGLSDNEAEFINNNINIPDRLDTRPDQLILSVSLLL